MQQVLITGGTGTIGKALTKQLLAKGYGVMILSRSGKGNIQGVSYYRWDIAQMQIDEEAIKRADFVIHLAGAGVADKRWTTQRKKEILNSRVAGSTLIVQAIQQLPNQIQAVISASAIGWYGADTHITTNGFVETDPAYTDFLGDTCKQWEESIKPVTAKGIRLVILRTGIVLSNEGGAFKEFLQPLKFRMATILGNGNQWISWIHVNDLCSQYINAIENKNWEGIYNAVAPEPVSNRTLITQMARHLFGNVFISLKVPAWLLKIVLGEMSIEILKSTKVAANKIMDTGYVFQFPTINSAIKDLLPTKSNRASDEVENR